MEEESNSIKEKIAAIKEWKKLKDKFTAPALSRLIYNYFSINKDWVKRDWLLINKKELMSFVRRLKYNEI